MGESVESQLEQRISSALARGSLSDAATLIVNGYGPGILGYLATLLRDDDAAREAFSEVGEELWKALPRFEQRSSAKTWAYAIAYRCALRQRRARARRRTRPLHDSEYARIAASVRSVSRGSFPHTAASQKLESLRRTLSDAEQTLLVLRLDRGMSWEDIAEVLAPRGKRANPATLRKRFERLKQRLRQSALREGLIGEKSGE